MKLELTQEQIGLLKSIQERMAVENTGDRKPSMVTVMDRRVQCTPNEEVDYPYSCWAWDSDGWCYGYNDILIRNDNKNSSWLFLDMENWEEYVIKQFEEWFEVTVDQELVEDYYCNLEDLLDKLYSAYPNEVGDCKFEVGHLEIVEYPTYKYFLFREEAQQYVQNNKHNMPYAYTYSSSVYQSYADSSLLELLEMISGLEIEEDAE